MLRTFLTSLLTFCLKSFTSCCHCLLLPLRLVTKMLHALLRREPSALPGIAVGHQAPVKLNRRARIVARLRPAANNAWNKEVNEARAPNGDANEVIANGVLHQLLLANDNLHARPPAAREAHLNEPPAQQQESAIVSMEDAIKTSCIEVVLTIFPDICADHLKRIAEERAYDPESVISFVVDEIEQGRPYTKRPKANVTAKRKREDSEEPEPDVASKYENPDRDGDWDSTIYGRLW
jgi:hypothetical protein